jgi:hypothetical protein
MACKRSAVRSRLAPPILSALPLVAGCVSPRQLLGVQEPVRFVSSTYAGNKQVAASPAAIIPIYRCVYQLEDGELRVAVGNYSCPR